MALLHGNWIPGDRCFFLWGETWRSLEAVNGAEMVTMPEHPLSLHQADLVEFLRVNQVEAPATSASASDTAPAEGWQLPPAIVAWCDQVVPPKAPGRSTKATKSAVKSAQSTRTTTGRVRNSTKAVAAAPIAVKTETLVGAIAADQRWTTYQLAIPTHFTPMGLVPLSTGTNLAELPDIATDDVQLMPWRVAGLRLSVAEALTLLHSLPLGLTEADSVVAPDLRFWAHIARWSLDLMARAKFVPLLTPTAHEPHEPYETHETHETDAAIATHWQVLLDNADDQARLTSFARTMPSGCRFYVSDQPAAYQVSPTEISPTAAAGCGAAGAIALPQMPQTLLRSSLDALIDRQVRSIAITTPIPPTQLTRELPIREWLQALGKQPELQAEPGLVERLQSALKTWTSPLQSQLNARIATFRTCFRLEPPAPPKRGKKTSPDWTLHYELQAIDDPDCRLIAATIWENPVAQMTVGDRPVIEPQETFLTGLGLAARFYAPIEATLTEAQPQSCTLDPIQAYDFLRQTVWQLRDRGFGVVLPPSLESQGGWANRLGLSLQVQPPTEQQRLGLQSLLNYDWALAIGGQTISQAEFNRLVKLDTPLVNINGEWVELRPQDIKAAQNFFASRQNQNSLSIEDALRISTGDNPMLDKLPVVNFEANGALKDLITTLTTGNQTLAELSEPEGFQGELRPYQARGVSWLSFLEQWGLGACLADDMGLGKTIQLIAFLLHLRERGMLTAPVLLVCPTSVLGNWEREVRKFAPKLKTLVHHGSDRPKGTKLKRDIAKRDLVITSYALSFRDLKDLRGIDWQGVVLDEAQNIKNSDTKQARAVRELNAQFRIALTGTPVENRLTELWSIMDFLNPGYLGPKPFFQKRFAIPIERYGDGDSLQSLRSLVQPFILRRLKTDRSIIQDLPEKQEAAVFCGLSPEQAALYQQLVDESLAAIDEADGVQRRGLILALLTKLKQVCNHPAQLLKEKQLGEIGRSGKLQRLNAMLEEVIAEGDRALIFTQFAEWGKLLQAQLEQAWGQEVLFLYGSTSPKKREEMVDRFQHDPRGPKLFILSLKAGGVGLNLTRANHVFHFDRWWNPAVENQATDRVFRIGQTRNVQVHKFVCTGTLEERIHDTIERKKALSEQVVGTGEGWLTELDANQLRDLLLLDRSAIIDETDEA